MPHLSQTNIHRYIDDPLLLIVPVSGLEANDTVNATWRVNGVVGLQKTIGSGVEVITGAQAELDYPNEDLSGIGASEAVLVVTVSAAEMTDEIGIGRWRWDTRAGGIEPEMVAYGYMAVSKRVPAPVVA